MNYKEYLAIKRACSIRIHLFSVSLHIVSVASLVQTCLLVMRIDADMYYLDSYLLDVLFSAGAAKMQEGNTIFAMISYGAYCACVLSFLFSSFMAFMTKRFPYVITFTICLFDALLELIVARYPHCLIRVALLVLIALAYHNRTNMNMLKNNTWGYD